MHMLVMPRSNAFSETNVGPLGITFRISGPGLHALEAGPSQGAADGFGL